MGWIFWRVGKLRQFFCSIWNFAFCTEFFLFWFFFLGPWTFPDRTGGWTLSRFWTTLTSLGRTMKVSTGKIWTARNASFANSARNTALLERRDGRLRTIICWGTYIILFFRILREYLEIWIFWKLINLKIELLIRKFNFFWNFFYSRFVDVLDGLPIPQIIQAYLAEYKEAITEGKNAKKTCNEIYSHKCKFSLTKLVETMKKESKKE